MKASAFEFRFRSWIVAVVVALGFWSPWNYVRHTAELEVTAANTHVWDILAFRIAPYVGPAGDPANIGPAYNTVLAIAIAFALAAALLRTWGTAYLGAAVVQSGAMQPGVVHDGPFRHLRNPLYLGLFLHLFALAILMSRSGALFTIFAVGLLEVRLIVAEEAFLRAQLGQAYQAYQDKVPSLLPALREKVPATGLPARWLQAFAAEIYFWGVVLGYAFLGWTYVVPYLLQVVIVSFGAGLLVQAFTPKAKATQS